MESGKAGDAVWERWTIVGILRGRGLSLRTKVLAAILLAVVPLAAAIVSFGLYVRIDERADLKLAEERELRLAVDHVSNLSEDAQTGVRGYSLTGRRGFLEPYFRATSVLPGELAALSDLQHGDHHKLVSELRVLTLEALSIMRRIAEGPPSKDTEAEMALAGNVTAQIYAITDELVEHSEEEIAGTSELRSDARARAYNTLLIGGGVGILASVLAGFVMVGGFVRRVRENTDNVRRLADGEELIPVDGGSDELATLSRGLHETALLLRARESSLRQAREEAEIANRAKSEFLSRMSHELRTPLNAVIGFAQILQQDVPPEAIPDVREILRAGKHLLALIDEVLDLSRIESGKITMSVEPACVSEVIEESVALVRGAAEKRSIDISIVDVEKEIHVLADRQRFKQVVVNLLSNAIKYNRDAGSVRVAVICQDDCVRIGVRDEGNGIPASMRDQLFAPFSRLGAEHTSIEGTGLGLALSKHLVEAMGGDIGLESEPGVGSTFWFSLPYTSEKAVASTPASFEKPSAGPPVNGDSEAVSVLQIEDNPSNVRLIQRALRSRGDIRLTTAMTGSEGLEALEDGPAPDLVLLDVNLPDMTGMDILIRMRANVPTRDIPVVVLSADATQAQIDQMMALGAERYLTKPIKLDELHEVFDSAVQRAMETAGDRDA